MRRQTYKDNLGNLRDQLLSYTDIQELYDILEEEIINTRKDIFSDGIATGLVPSNLDSGVLQITSGTFYKNGERVIINGNQTLNFSAQPNGTYYVYATYTETSLTRAVPQDRLLPPSDKVHRRSDYQFNLYFTSSNSELNIKVCSVTINSGLITGISIVFRDIFKLNYLRLNSIQAGNGLSFDAFNNILNVNVDNNTLEISSDILRIKESIYFPQRPYTVVVASSNASDLEKRLADYVCDGTADDVEINSAITAAVGFPGGGTVKLLSGTYYISSNIDVGSNVSLVGQGKYSTTLVKATTYDASAIILRIRKEHQYVTIRDLAINGLKADGGNSGTHYCIHVDDSDYVIIDNCYVNNGYTYGISIENGSTHCVISNCNVTGCNDDGIRIIDSGTDYHKVLNCDIYSNGGRGIYTNVSDNNIISNNHIYTNYVGMYLSSQDYNNIISNNYIHDNTSVGINISSSSDNNVITGNNVNGNSYGITLAGDFNTVTCNDLSNNANSAGGCLLIAGSNNVICGNHCYYPSATSNMINVAGNYNNVQGCRVSDGIAISGTGNLPASTQTSTNMANSSNVIIND